MSPPPPDPPLPEQRSYRAMLQPLRRALALVWMVDAHSTVGMAGLTLLAGILPAGQAWVAKLIIDGVTHSLTGHQDPQGALMGVLPYLCLEFGLIASGVVIAQLRALLDEILDHKIGFGINSRIIRKAQRLELYYFENAEFYDKMQNARRQSEYRAMAIVKAVFSLITNAITLGSFLVILLSFSAWVALLLFGATLPAFVAQTRLSRLNFRLQSWKAPETRRMNYLEHLLTTDTSAKEIKTFGLSEPLLERYSALFWGVFREDAQLAWRRSGVSLAWGLLAMVSYYGCYAWVVFRTLAATITLGSMTLYLAIFRQSQGAFAAVFDSINKLYENSLFMDNLFTFLDLPEMPHHARANDLPPLDPQRGLEIRDVSFRYPGQKAWALHEVTLQVAPGEKIALVGENGSGKTTLIKLLTRLYEPTHGQISYQGRDLRHWDMADLRRKMGVIFQDFVRYQLTLRENVGFGSVEDMGDDARLTRAAEQGGMDSMVPQLEEGWETTLGGWFQKGRDLSGGQWQKIALSRAFMREGEVIVLDEPTSALDAEKEYEIFRRFKDLTEGKIAFLISHRFSTVRMADRIVVLRQGSVEEQGSHATLIAHAGTYARLFELQAEGYR